MSVFPTKSLSAVCDISMGQAPKGDSYNATRRGYPLIAGAGDFGELTPAPKKYTDAPTKLSRPGDLILCICSQRLATEIGQTKSTVLGAEWLG